MSYPTVQGRAVEGLPFREARVCLGPKFANSYYLFFLSGTSTPTNVYQAGAPSAPFSPTGRVTADSFGRFPAIYLDTSLIYRVQFFNSANVQQWQVDPYITLLSTVGTSSLVAFGFTIAPTGEVTTTPGPGGSGINLTLNASTIGTTPLRLNGIAPGVSTLIINNAATTGAQTATFAATNKPGTSTSAPAGWLPITCDGVQYYTPIWHGNPFTPYTPAPTGSIIHIYTTLGSATEAILSGPIGNVQVEVWGGGGGSGGKSGISGGANGGGGALSYSSYSVSALGGAGSTINYSVPAGGAGGTAGNTGSTGVAGAAAAGTAIGFATMVGGGGVGGGPGFSGTPGAGGTASGGNIANTTGNSGSGAGSNIGLIGSVPSDGSPYGGGGPATSTSTGNPGSNGAVVFYYT